MSKYGVISGRYFPAFALNTFWLNILWDILLPKIWFGIFYLKETNQKDGFQRCLEKSLSRNVLQNTQTASTVKCFFELTCSTFLCGDFGCVFVCRFSFTLSWSRCLSHRNQSIDLHCKSADWFLYDGDLCHERIKDHPFSTYTKLSQNLTFLTPWFIIRGLGQNVNFSENFACVLSEWAIR